MHTVLPRKMGFDCVTVKSTKRERRRTLTRIMEEFQSADNMVAGWNFFTLQEIAFL